jgi:hypothetical protein
MIGIQHEVATRDELLAVVGNSGVRMITVTADLAEMPSFRLSPGQMLLGNGHRICFAASQDGVQLTTDNEVAGLGLIADPTRRALFNDTSVQGFGRILLRDLYVIGAVRMLARERVWSGHVEAHDIDIVAADTRATTSGRKVMGWRSAPGRSRCGTSRPIRP